MATIAEKSRTKEIIDRLQGIIDSASPMPLGAGKVVVYKDEVQSLLTELATQMEIELKTYHEVNDRKGKIINEAKKEAEQIIYQAEHTASRMRVNKRATNVAPLDYEQLDEEERNALGNANEIYAASLIYTDEMLTEVTDMIADAYNNIRSDYEVILQVMEEKLNIINSNRAELMDGLQEMELEDRGQQILEIGKLLSDELYNSRMKARMNSDEYEDGSVQLRLDLQEEQEEKTRQAEAVAQQAVAALAEVTAERDALMATVSQMKQEGMRQTVRQMKAVPAADALSGKAAGKPSAEAAKEPPAEEAEEEYEIVYVSEDELEEGEEYEIEYVDDEEYEEREKSENARAVQAKEKTAGDKTADGETVPIIPHFKKSEKIASASSEQIAKMATAITTEKKYSGLISRAVAEREKAEAPVKVEKTDTIQKPEEKRPDAAEPKKDEDIKTDALGNEYVQATMKFDEDYEIMEF